MSGTEAHDKADVHTTNKRAWCIAIALIMAVLTITALMTSRSSFDMTIATKVHVKGRCVIKLSLSLCSTMGRPLNQPNHVARTNLRALVLAQQAKAEHLCSQAPNCWWRHRL